MADNGWTPLDNADSTGSDSASSGGWAPVSSGNADGTPQGFAKAYAPVINNIASKLNVDPSIIAGQLALETGNGKHVVPGTNNLGNIKSTNGKGVTATDNQTGSNDAYQVYPDHDAFGNAYTDLIQRKYPDAVGAKDATAFATALQKGGYAQDPKYVSKVSNMANVMSNVLGAITGSTSANANEKPQASTDTSDVASFVKQYGAPAPAKTDTQAAAQADSKDDDVDSFLKQYGPKPADKAPGTVTTTTNPVMMGARDSIYGKLDPVMGWIAKGANWIAPDSQFAKDAAQGVKDLHATNAAQQQAYDSVDHGIGDKVARVGTDLTGAVALTPMSGGGLGNTIVQTGAQGFLGDPDHPFEGTAVGAAGGVVGHALGAVVKPIVSKVTGATKKLAGVDAQATQAGTATGDAFSDAEKAMAGKVAENINASGQKAGDVAAEMQANANSAVPGYQRTAAEATQNPTVQATQQGLDKSGNNAGLAARATANAEANTDHLRQAATSDTHLQGMRDAFEEGQGKLAAQGNAEMGPVTAAQSDTVFNTPAMQRNLGRANTVALNDGENAIQRAFDAPNDDLVAGWNGLAGSSERTAALERERNFITSPMYEGVLGAAKPLPVAGELADTLNTPIMQKALREVETYKLNALDKTPVINKGHITPQDLNIAKMHLDDYIQRMSNPMDIASADQWQKGAFLALRKKLNNTLESKVKGFADVNAEFARRSEQIAESKFLTDPNMVSAIGKLNVNKLDSLVKAIEAGHANTNPMDPAKSISKAKLAQLSQLRDDAVASMNRKSAEGLHGKSYDYIRQAAEKDPVAAQQVRDHLENNSLSYKMMYADREAGTQKIAHQENMNNLVKKFDTRADGNVAWHDVRKLGTSGNDFAADHMTRLNNVRDNLQRYATRTEKVAGSDTASNLAKKEGFESLVAAERGNGIGNFIAGEHGQTAMRMLMGPPATLAGAKMFGKLGATAGDFLGDKFATGTAKFAGRLLGGDSAASLEKATAANRDAIEKLLLHPQRFGDAITALEKAGVDKKVIKESLISNMNKVKGAGGLLGALTAGQIASYTNDEKRKK